MNSSTFSRLMRRLRRAMVRTLTRLFFPRTRNYRPGQGLTIIFPFERRGGVREENYEWLWEFYREALPDAQIVTEGYPRLPFNKSAAVNAAFQRATGDVIAILDADALLDPEALLQAAADCRRARVRGLKTWVMPYRRLYRLTQDISAGVLDYYASQWRWVAESVLAEPVDPSWYDNHGGGSHHGHMFGAMAQVMPREAFEVVGGWDERFAGWGGEDVSFARALDTLWGRHTSLDGPIFHLWHPTGPPSRQWATSRSWDGQDLDDRCNAHLAQRYYQAYNDYDRMRSLSLEWLYEGS